MILIRILDNRCINGYRIEFFYNDHITKEIIDFVKNNPKAYWIETKGKTYHTREDFFKEHNAY